MLRVTEQDKIKLFESEFERVGGSHTLKGDVRIIAATHRDLEHAVAAGDFCEDLFYHLSVMPIYPTPLRERIEDIPDIARLLLAKIGKVQGRKLTIQDGALRRLSSHKWPGNMREMENCLERAAILSEEGTIDPDLIRFVQMRERLATRHPESRRDRREPCLPLLPINLPTISNHSSIRSVRPGPSR